MNKEDNLLGLKYFIIKCEGLLLLKYSYHELAIFTLSKYIKLHLIIFSLHTTLTIVIYLTIHSFIQLKVKSPPVMKLESTRVLIV